MVAFETLSHTFQHPWNIISLASWKKYPNPARPDVVSIDLVRRELDQQTGVLYTTRIVAIKSFLPKWIENFVGSHPLYFVEEAMCDPRKNKMVLKAHSVSFNNIVKMEEQCTYTPHPQNSNWTHFDHRGKVTVEVLKFGLTKKIEEFCVQTWRSNAAKGREIMEQAIAKVKQEKMALDPSV